MISQPSESQASLDDINNRITMAEAELKRLKKLSIAEEYTVGELVKQKQYLEDEAERLLATIATMNEQIGNINDNKKQLDDLRSQLVSREQSISNREADVELRVEKLSADISEFDDKKNGIYNDISEKEDAIKLAQLDVKKATRELTIIIESMLTFSSDLHKRISDIGN